MNPGLTWSSLVHWHTIVPVIIHSYYASRPKAGLGTRGFSLISRLCEISRLATAFYSQPQHSTTLGLGSAFLPCVEWSVYFNHVWQWFNQESSSQLGPIIESGMSLIGRQGFGLGFSSASASGGRRRSLRISSASAPKRWCSAGLVNTTPAAEEGSSRKPPQTVS